MTKLLILLIVLFGLFRVYSGFKKLKETKDGSFRFLNLVSNKRLRDYSGIEQIATGIMVLGAAVIILAVIIF